MDLRPDGSIGEGAAGGERRWVLRNQVLEISGDYGVLCQLERDTDGVWRGNWIQFGRMPVELYPHAAIVPPMPANWNTFSFPESDGFWWSNYECLGQAVRKLCRQLPPLKAVAGIPRSGVIPASLIAQWQNIPLLDIDEALVSKPHLPTYRRRSSADVDDKLPILIVDDTVSSGRTLSWYKSRALVHGKGKYLFAAPYVDRRCRPFVDFAAEDHPQCHQAFEWNLLHEVGHTQFTLCDLDGVISQDWSGDEERDPVAYRHHLLHARPLCRPTMPVRGIVTGRMHIHRTQTTAWLNAHGVRHSQLWMLPAATERERAAIGPARFKARTYAESNALLFVESCPIQAREIHELTGKPVIDFTNMIAHGATIVR